MSGNRTIGRRQTLKYLAGSAAAIVSGLSLGSTPALASSYTLFDIGETDYASDVYQGLILYAISINNDGVVVGTMRVDAEKVSPWTYAHERRNRIPTGKFGAHGRQINDQGVVCGQDILEWFGKDIPIGRPVLWINGEKETLPYPDELVGPHRSGIALGVNNGGTVVGTVEDSGGIGYPVVWRDGQSSTLPTPYRWQEGRADFINDSGVIVGTAFDDLAQPRAVVWDANGVRNVPTRDNTANHIAGLTNDGRLVGFSVAERTREAVVWPNPDQLPTPLEKLAEEQLLSEALAGNGRGVAVGYAQLPGFDQRAVVWTDDDVIDLSMAVADAAGVDIAMATAINDEGWIAGAGYGGRNKTSIHSFLLVPDA